MIGLLKRVAKWMGKKAGDLANSLAKRRILNEGALPLPIPNPGACALFASRSFQRRVNNPVVECYQLAEELYKASGETGGTLQINNGSRPLKIPEKGIVTDRFDFHVVYTDGEFVFDPRYRDNPIPRAEYEAETRQLNGEEVSITLEKRRPQDHSS